jgi:hypothetical protein
MSYVALGSGIIPVDPIIAGKTFIGLVSTLPDLTTKKTGLTMFTLIPSGASTVERLSPMELLEGLVFAFNS